MPATDHKRMKGIGDDAPIEVVAQVKKIVDPVLQHAASVHQSLQDPGWRANELEVREVVERPAHRRLDQPGHVAEHGRLFELDHVPLSHPIRDVIVRHHATVVDESVPDQEFHRVRAQVPRRRAVTARMATGKFSDPLVGAHEPFFFLFTGKLGWRHVRPAMVPDLVAGVAYAPALIRIRRERMARDEPARLNPALLEQRQDPGRSDVGAELAARDRRGRGHAARNKPRHGVEIKRQTNDMSSHQNLVTNREDTRSPAIVQTRCARARAPPRDPRTRPSSPVSPPAEPARGHAR